MLFVERNKGSGISGIGCKLSLEDCVINSNKFNGIDLAQQSDVVMLNSLITSNQLSGVSVFDSKLEVKNCKIIHNLNGILQFNQKDHLNESVKFGEENDISLNKTNKVEKDVKGSLLEAAYAECTCTFAFAGPQHLRQEMYECYTCGLCDLKCCCKYCALTCHEGHDVVKVDDYDGLSFCDCFFFDGCFCTFRQKQME